MTNPQPQNLKKEKVNIDLKKSIKILEPHNVKKFALKDPEKILYDNLYARFGQRFVDYRIHGPIFLSCILLVSFFLYPSILNEIVSNISIF